MSYQKSVALLSCCLLFSISFANLALASVTGTPSGEPSGESGVTRSFAHPAMFASLPPDTEGPTLTINPPSDVNLIGCYSDFTYSVAAMGKPGYVASDDCGTATVTETISDTYVYCTDADDGTPEGGLTILREFSYLAVDCFGNETEDSVVQSITVSDNVAPSFNEALPADTTVDCAAIPAAPVLTATDDCDSEASVSYSETSGTTCEGLVRTWVAVDDCGNTTTHVQNITVTDTENPVISDTPSDINQTADAGECGAVVTWTAPTATDNCTLDTFTSTHNSGDFFDVGTTTVTYTAMDDCGNSTSTSFDITITDDENPTLSGIPSDITQTADAGQCGAVVTWPAASDMPAPSADDNCSAVLTSTHDSGDTFAVGTTTVTYTATDPSGNTVSESFTVTITDDEAPTIGLVYAEDFENETPADANDLCLAGSAYTPADANWSLGPACLVPTNGIPRLVNDGGDTFLEYNQKYPTNSEVWNSADMDVTGLDQVTISFDARSIGGLESYGSWEDNFALYAVIDGTEQATPLVAFSGHVDGTGESPGDNSRSEEASFSETLSLSGASGLSLRIRVTISGSDGSETYQVNDFLVSSNPTDMTQTADAGNCSAVVTWVAPEAADNCAVTSFTSTHNSGDAFAVGTTTVVYTAMDEAGNTTTHSFDIVVTDDEDPTISGTPADITQTADAGVCDAAVTWTAPTSDDNCAIATFTSTHNPGDTFDVGTTAVTYTATDVHGNSTTSTFNVTVTDDENPVITGLPANITVSNDAGECGADVYWTEISNPDATDNCSIDTFTSDYSSGAFFTVGTTTVTYTATDIHGNSSTASFTVTVTDAEAPSITDMPSNLSVDTDAGQCAAVVTWVAPTFGDNCNVATTGSNYSSGESFGTGTTTVTYTATDDAGNTTTSSFTVTVTDNEDPTIANTPADVSVTNDAGICGASVTWADPTPNDNCGIQDLTSSHDSGSIFAVGTTAVTFTATDTNGNTTTSTFDITVTDTEDPTFSGMPANITQTADAGNCSAEVDWTAPTADDNCAVQSLTSDHDPMDDFPVGTTTVTYTATDIHGNSATSSFTITVTDDEAPTIADTPSNITVSNDAGLCSADVTWTAPTADDNCPGTSLTSTHNSGDTFTVGTTTVTYTAEDAAGNQTTSSFTVTVTDDEAPMIGSLYSEDFENETPADASNLCLPGNIYTPGDANWSIGEACLVPTNGIPQLTDVAGDTHIHFNQKYPANSEVWNSATMDVAAYSEVQVSFDARSVGGLENSGPFLDDFAIYAVLDGVEQGTPIVAFNGHVDGSGNGNNSVIEAASFSETVATNGASGLALRIRVMISGGDGSESYQVDDISVDAILSDLALSNAAGVCSAAASWPVPSATDNCSVTLTSTHNPGDSFDVGTTTVTYTATDPASNEVTASFDVVVSDDEAPTISGTPADITQTADAGVCTAAVSWTAPTSDDNCAIATFTSTHNPGDTFDVGTTAVTYTATDVNGNTTTSTFDVTVTDDENPAITGLPSNITVSNDAGECGADVSWNETSNPDATDNCGINTFTADYSSGAFFNVGTTTVTYTATDIHGNSSTASFTVTVLDAEAPAISAQADLAANNDAGNCSAVVTWTAPTESDNCAVTSFTSTHNPGDAFEVGTTTVTYTAEDAAGNQTTMSFDVVVTDNESPVIAGNPGDQSANNDAGICGAVVNWTAPTATDNCSQTLTSTHNPGDLFAVGTTSVTYTSTDPANNTSTISFNVVVTDTEDPVIAPMMNDTVSTDAGTCEAVVNFSDPVTTDNCAVATLTSDIASGSTFSLGSTTVSFTATDIHGNTTTSTFDIVVEDNEAPTIGTPACDMQVECDGAGNTTALTNWLNANGDAVATDNCSAVTWDNDFTTMANTCGGAGAVQVVFTAEDEAGNTSTSTATFTIVDTTAPTITLAAQDTTTECDGSGNMTQFNAWLANQGGATASESCSSVTWSNDYLGDDGEGGTNDFSDGCGATGSITITFTATDVCGNASNTSATFTIEDTTNPTAVAQNHTVLLDASGNGTMVAGDINNGSSDGCSGVTMSASKTSFTCSDLGANTVTLTVTDACSNVSTATATVTVKDEVAPNITVAASDTTFECNGTDYSAQFAAWLADHGGAEATDACGPLAWTNNSSGLVPGCGDSESEEVTFTVTDGSGNTSSTTATFSVTDTAPPTIASDAIDITLECNGTGNTVELNAWLLANGGAGEATDLCGDVTWSHNFDDYALTCAGTGAVEVIFSATDDCGNAATTTAMFEIVDTTAPTLTLAASDSTVECGSSNAADLSAWLANHGGATADELCGTVTWTNDYTALSDDCGNTGSAAVTFTASDDCGNTTTTTATFTIEDTTSPTALGSDLTVTLDGNGQATITADDIDNGSSDACGDVTLSIDVTSFDCDDVGPNDVVLTVTDECMNAASATVTVIVTAVDDTAPTISNLPENITQNNDAGNCSAVVTYTMPSFQDNCAGGSIVSDFPSGTAFPVGATTVTFTATDPSGNDTTATFTVTVLDAEAPTISAQADLAANNDAGLCSAVVTWAAPTSDDNCGVTSFTSTHNPGDAFAVGTTTVTYTAEDAAGNETTMSFDVVVTDNENPAIAGTPANITQTADAGLCSAVVNWTAATASDNCAIATFSSDHSSGDAFPVGTTTVTYTATDIHGNTTTSTFDITVTDDEDPTLYNVPADITQTADAGQCGAVVEWEYYDALSDTDVYPYANDNCGMATFVLSHNDGDTFPVGTTTVTITATDIHGNISTDSFDVTITDDEAPVIADTPANISQTNDAGNCSAVVTWTEPTDSDNCAIATFTSTHNPGDTFEVGTTTVTYTATDIHSNVSTSSFTVTVTDDENPVISGTPADITQDNDLGNCSAAVTWVEPTADDNCDIDTFTSTHNPGDTFAVGTTTVTYTATDIHSNVSTSSFDITVEDAENPVITTEASDLTVECDGSGNTTELNNWLNNHGGSVASDNCAVTSITNDYDVANMSDDCGLTGSILVTFTHTDAAGNSATSSATFTIEDTTPPTFMPNGGSVTVECDGTGNVDEIDAWLNLVNSSTASDVCGGITLEKTTSLLTDGCAATGEASVNFLITDDCGNQVDTTLTFTIVDTMGPVFLTTADDLTVECDGAGNTAALQAWLDNHAGATAEDVCGDFTWSNDFDALSDDCGATGSRTVTFTATDECGNASYTSATFTIEDTTAPTIASEAMDMTVECDGLGNTAALNGWLAANGNAGAASDICGGVTWSNDFTALSDDCGATGTATVIFTATDDCGNATSTTATFTIEDTTVPSIASEAIDMTVECDGSGNTAQLNAWLAANGNAGAASDDCSSVTWSNDFTALSDLCGATGAATVTFTATDECGLSSSTTATFTIEDTTPPSMDVAAADMTVECDGAGNPTELNDWLTSNGGASASDECSGVTWTNDFTALSDLCGATGAATVTFTATDECGLSTSTTATFTIEDTTAPVLTGDEVVIIDCSAWPWEPLYQPTIDELLSVVDTAGNPIITLDEACGYTNFPIDFGVMSGGCNYDHQLIYYPIDDCGNEGDSLYQVIQVDDYTDPTFLTVPADTMIACTEDVSVYLEMATAEDACDPSVNMTFEDEILPTACPEEYTIRRTFYAEDCGYNIATAIQNITVADTAAPALALTAPADMAVNGCLSSADLSEAAMGSVTWTTSDDCGDVTVTYTTSDANAFSCTGDDDADEGSYVVTRTFTVTATDCAGNSTTESIDQTITITDDTAPTVSLDAPADETVYLDASCYAAPLATPVSGDASGFLVTATDNCDSDVAHTIAVSDDTTYTGVVDGVGSYEILRTYTVTVMDDCENEATATTSHTIFVLDEIAPDVTGTFPADIIIYADDDNGYFDPTPLSTGAASADYSDNCSGEGDQTYGVAGQVPTGGLIITAIGDPNDAASTCRFVEIHNSGDSDIDLTGYALQRWTNGNAGPSTGSNIDLSSIGTMAPGQYAWIANNAGFADCYGFAATITAGTGGPADSNGDDQIAIIDGASNIVDMFGVAGEDGSNTCHEFEDGIALRAGSNTDPNGGAWDESGWIVYSDGSSASGCTNHNSNQPQNASDIALLINNWAGAGPAAPETDFNSVDISFADETTSYTASACYTFERTWTITVTDNNGNATTVTDVQTIQVADTSAPDITALENTTAACDLFGFDLTAGDQSTVLAYTSFEEGTSGDQYVDTGDASVDHALANNPGQSDVNFTSTGGEMGFSSYYYATGSSGLTDGDFVGVTSFTGVVSAFTDGSQGFQMQDTDGIMEVVFDNVDVSMGGVTLMLDYFPQSTGWETADRIRIWVVADGGEIDLVDTEGEDIDNLGIEGQWNLASLDLDGFDDVQLHISLESNSGSEGLFIDNIAFSTGNSPLAALEANGFVSFSDNVELASTEAAITLDGTPCEGAYDIVYTATDSCGNTTTSSQRIVLEDTVDPILTVETPEAVTLYTDADCFADYVDGVPYPAASATDNCDEDVEITSSHFDGTKQYTCLPGTGAFSVTRTYLFTATDNCGNTTDTTVTRLVTVVDNIAPTFTAAAPADKTVNIDPFCGANTSTTIAGMPTVTDVDDNCDSNVDIDIEHADSAPVYTCSDADGAAEGSYTFERTFTITGTDDCGNETVQTVTQTITALDVTAPTITALPPMAAANYTLDGDCMADLTPTAEPVATAVDACDSEVTITSTYADGAPTYTCDGADGEAEGSFTFTRTWTVTATDDCDNSTSQITTQTVVVTDEGAPSIDATYPADYTTDLDADCNADLSTAAAGAATATADDACDSDVSVAISYADHDTTMIFENADDLIEGSFTFTRTWTVTATDDCGNETTETHDQTITANDVTAPTQDLETLPTYTVEGCYGEVDLDPSVTGTPMLSAEDGCDSDVDTELTYSTDDLVFNEVVGDYSLVIDTISGPEDGVLGMTTVRLYIETENEDDFISAVAGDEINPTGIRTTTSFYQNLFGAATANSYNDGLTLADPLVAYDSWVTIGIDQQPDGGAGEGETTVVGDWTTDFEAGGDLLINDFFGGSWFTTSPNTAAVAGPDHRVLLGQFTTDGQMSGQMFVQVFPNGLGAQEMRISFTFGDCAEDDDTPEGSYAFTRRWESVATDDAGNASTATTYQHIQVLDTEAPQLTNTCGLNNGETVAYDCPGIGVLDFDPVPVACDVTAIDNCDSEVNVTLFTETEGYIPTDDIRNYCAPTTPEALNGNQTCDDRAPEVLRLFNFPGSEDSFVMADGENLIQVMSDGSMHIELEVENADGTGGFLFTAEYGAGQDWATWSAGGSNYKKDCAEIYPGETIWEDWIYFLMTSGTLEGTGMYTGSSFTLTHQPANGYYGMQMGLGANNKNTNYGGSAWFFWQGDLVIDGTDMGPMASSGDVFMDLDCCLEWSVDYFYTAIDDCGNPTGFNYSETMGADLEGGDATASGGHTVGPVDITSIGGIKEPIRITGLAPNPTNNNSQLSFVVAENMRLRVDLYTMGGTLVQELYEGNAVTGVQYIMDIDAEGLSDGMYQVRISSNTYLAVKKLLVAN